MPDVSVLRFVSLVLFGIIVGVSVRASAAVDMYLKFTGADGKAITVTVEQDGGFKTPALKAGKYTVEWTLAQPMPAGQNGDLPPTIVFTQSVQTSRETGSGMAAGRRMPQPNILRRQINKSSPLLATGLGSITIDADGSVVAGKIEFQTASGKIKFKQEFGPTQANKKN